MKDQNRDDNYLYPHLGHDKPPGRWPHGYVTFFGDGGREIREIYLPKLDILEPTVWSGGREVSLWEFTRNDPRTLYAFMAVGSNKNAYVLLSKLSKKGINDPVVTFWATVPGDLAFGARTQRNGASPGQRIWIPEEQTRLTVGINLFTFKQAAVINESESVSKDKDKGNYFVGLTENVRFSTRQELVAYEYVGKLPVLKIGDMPVRFREKGARGNIEWRADGRDYSWPLEGNYTAVVAGGRPPCAVARTELEVMKLFYEAVWEKFNKPLYDIRETDGRSSIQVAPWCKDYRGPERQKVNRFLMELLGQPMRLLGTDPITRPYEKSDYMTLDNALKRAKR